MTRTTRPSLAADILGRSVREFGARLDGRTDDTARYQDAVDAAAADGGGYVFSPADATAMISTLNLRTGVTLAGGGWKSVLKQIPGVNGHLIQSADGFQYHYGIRDLALDGNKANQTTANDGIHLLGDASMGGGYGPWFSDMRPVVQNVFVGYTKGSGLYLGDTVREAVLDNIYCIYPDVHGFHLDTGATDNVLTNCAAGVVGKTGYYLQGAINTRGTNCKAFMTGQLDSTNFGDGFRVGSSNGSKFTSCETQQTLRHAFRLDSSQYNSFAACNAGESRSDAWFLAGGNCSYNNIQGTVWPANTVFVTPSAWRRNSALTVGNRVNLTVEPGYVTRFVEASFGAAENDITINGQGSLAGLTYTASLTPDPYKYQTGLMTLTGNVTVNAPVQAHGGQRLRFDMIQDATGGRTMTFNAAFKVPAGFVPDTTAGKRNIIEFEHVSGANIWTPVSWATGL